MDECRLKSRLNVDAGPLRGRIRDIPFFYLISLVAVYLLATILSPLASCTPLACYFLQRANAGKP